MPGYIITIMLRLVSQAIQLVVQDSLRICIDWLTDGYQLTGTASAVPMTRTRRSPVLATPAVGRLVGFRLTVCGLREKTSIFLYVSDKRTYGSDTHA